MCKTPDLKHVDDKRLSRFINQCLIVFGILVLLLGALSASGRCTEAPIANSLGVVIENRSPFVYLMGLPVRGTLLYDKGTDKWATSVTLSPSWATMLFEQTVLLCGDQTDSLGGLRGVLVITYRARAAVMFQGIACHSFISASEVVIKEAK